MDLNAPFLTKQIIAYLGNKRKLLPLIHDALMETIPGLSPGLKFLDVFAGSGVVSRLAKSLNFEVYSNDWEQYSYIINDGYLKTNLGDITTLFGSERKFRSYLHEINELPPPEEEDQYIAKYYAPKTFDIDDADFRAERLFYTRDNALRIDKIRNFIDQNHPEGGDNRKRNLLLALLLYQAATHTNTSGVFKAYHKGFGGHTRAALKRILAPIRLDFPVLIDSDYPIHLFRTDANRLIKMGTPGKMDIAYIDPPYNQHQYGSNYHLLNTITLWDKVAVPLTLNEGGMLKKKAGIRKDWVKTRSDYCYAESALSAFTDLLENLEARYILISYSTDGLIPFETMKEICARKGRLSILTNEYAKYRGGKQSNRRLNSNIEWILTIETEEKSTKASLKEVETILARKKTFLMFKLKYNIRKLKEISETMGDSSLSLRLNGKKLDISTIHNFELITPDNLKDLSKEENEELLDKLGRSACPTKEEELKEIIARIDGSGDDEYFLKLIPQTLEKLAQKKNRHSFARWLSRIKELESSHQNLYSSVKEKVLKVEAIANKRFSS